MDTEVGKTSHDQAINAMKKEKKKKVKSKKLKKGKDEEENRRKKRKHSSTVVDGESSNGTGVDIRKGTAKNHQLDTNSDIHNAKRSKVDSHKNGEKKKKKKDKKKKKKRKREKHDVMIDDGPVSIYSERLVASSAIEFYDDSLKKKVKRKDSDVAEKESTRPDHDRSQNRQVKDDCSSISVFPSVSAKNGQKNDDNDDGQRMQQQKINKKMQENQRNHSLTLLLFYQYVEPKWDQSTYDYMLTTLQNIGTDLKLTGRMRVAQEGLNCTLTGSHESIVEYCNTLRRLSPPSSSSSSSKSNEQAGEENQSPEFPFTDTEFKLTTDLPEAQRFPNLKVFKVVELVHYGLEHTKAPPIHKYHGTHLEPADYHKKIAEPNTVIIDVRNHYEAAIGRFVPPQEEEEEEEGNQEEKDGFTPTTKSSIDADGNGSSSDLPPPKWLDPKMRKSTEFPQWLDRPETKEEMKGKQVLMYCTGGIRCERASALLKYKMETDPDIAALGIKGVYQLQGGIDKYFKEFPDGGYWHGKNYVFDKRFAHAPPKIDAQLHGRDGNKDEQSGSKLQKQPSGGNTSAGKTAAPTIMGKCEACQKPWDMYRGKRRCPSCGVPSLICKECFLADKEGVKKLDKNVRCDLCVEQGIFSKRDLKMKDEKAIQAYEEKMKSKGLLQPERAPVIPPNPGKVTRLYLKNMCRKNMTEESLLEIFPTITHIVWKTDRNTGRFMGSAWVEMKTPDDASRAVAQDNKVRVFGRPMGISFQSPGGKDAWPPPNSAVGRF